MKLLEFSATKARCEDLGLALDDASLIGRPGYLYLGKLYIEDRGGDAALQRYGMAIDRELFESDEIESLEKLLYVFAAAEGYLPEGETDNAV